MLRNQLVSRAEVLRLVANANHALLTGHQHVDEVVDHNHNLDAINRGEHAPILRQEPVCRRPIYRNATAFRNHRYLFPTQWIRRIAGVPIAAGRGREARAPRNKWTQTATGKPFYPTGSP